MKDAARGGVGGECGLGGECGALGGGGAAHAAAVRGILAPKDESMLLELSEKRRHVRPVESRALGNGVLGEVRKIRK